MKSWLTELFSQTLLSVWWIFSALSTISTFLVISWAGKPRIVFALFALVGFSWANFNVFKKQQAQNAALKRDLESHTNRISKLTIRLAGVSRYILVPVPGTRHADFRGAYFEFELSIENKGTRNSIVDKYRIEVMEFNANLTDLMPDEGRTRIQGRHCQYGLEPKRILSTTHLIRVNAESVTNVGTLLFYLPDISLEQFAEAGMSMQGEERKFGALNCVLTLSDTMGMSASETFELHEG